MSDVRAGPGTDALLEAWAARVRANREQSERVREGPEPDDFYAPVRGLFVADPRRADDATLAALLELARPEETWLDIGAGAGRFALPLALRVREVIALDPSEGMLQALREGMERHGIRNLRVIHARWPIDALRETALRADAVPRADSQLRADVVLVAHLGYDIEAIGPFIDAMEAAAGRLCVAVMSERVPSAPAGPFWPPVHGEPRVELPAFGEFLAILRARGHDPEVTYEPRQSRGFATQGALLIWLRNQLFVAPGSAADARLVAELGPRISDDADGSAHLVPDIGSRVAVARWVPRP